MVAEGDQHPDDACRVPYSALVLTRSDVVYVLSHNNGGALEEVHPADVLQDWPSNERVVAASLHRLRAEDPTRYLVGLGASGTLGFFEWSPGRTVMKSAYQFTIRSPSSLAVFDGLVRWPGGVAVLASDYVAFLPYDSDGRKPFAASELQPRWIRVPSSTSISVWRPY